MAGRQCAGGTQRRYAGQGAHHLEPHDGHSLNEVSSSVWSWSLILFIGVGMRLLLHLNQRTLRAVITFAFSLVFSIALGLQPAFGQNNGVTNIFRPLSQPAQEI